MSTDNRWRIRPRKAVPGVEARERRDALGAYWVFRVRWIDPTTGAKLTETCDSPQDAIDFRAEQRRLARRGQLEDLDKGRETLHVFAAEWFVWAHGELAASTVKSYASNWTRHLLPRVGQLQLRAVTPKVIEDLKTQLLVDGVGAPTVHRCLALLQAMFRQAVRWDRALANPVMVVSKPRVTRIKKIAALTVPQVEEIRAWLLEHRNTREAMLVELMAYTGARPQDALALPWGAVSKTRLVYARKNVDGTILAGAKTGATKTRDVELLKTLRTDLLAYRMASGHPAADDLVVPDVKGQPWTNAQYRKWQTKGPKDGDDTRTHRSGPFTKAARAAGLPDITPYHLRHTFASLRLAEQRLSLQEIAEEMGHGVDVLAGTYSHVISDVRGQGPIDPDTLIREARAKLASPGPTSAAGPQDDPTEETA